MFTNPPSGRKPATVSIRWLEDGNGRELPCPFTEEMSFADPAAVVTALRRYFGEAFTFEPGQAELGPPGRTPQRQI